MRTALILLVVVAVGVSAAVVASPQVPRRASVDGAQIAVGSAVLLPFPHADPLGRQAVWIVRLAADRWAALSPANPWKGPGKAPSPCELR